MDESPEEPDRDGAPVTPPPMTLTVTTTRLGIASVGAFLIAALSNTVGLFADLAPLRALGLAAAISAVVLGGIGLKRDARCLPSSIGCGVGLCIVLAWLVLQVVGWDVLLD